MSLLLDWRVWAALGVIALAFWGQTMRMERDAIKAEYAEYRTKVAQAAQAAAEQALKKTIEDEHRKEASDAENLRLRADLDATTRRLRDARAGSNFVPAATASATDPARACFDRSELERALRDFDTGLQSLIDEGGRAVIDLDTAKRWAVGR